MKYREGMIVKGKSGYGEAKILGVCGQVVFLYWPNTLDIIPWEAKRVDECFTILSEPKEEWVPEIGCMYWYIDDVGAVCNDDWWNSAVDKCRRDFMGISRTRDDAQAQLEKIKKLLAEGK